MYEATVECGLSVHQVIFDSLRKQGKRLHSLHPEAPTLDKVRQRMAKMGEERCEGERETAIFRIRSP
jgi:hypothetical protein